jgi:2-amino-4-hydroxy-6-hydroxymethyldihydropteridine diphosphokinase
MLDCVVGIGSNLGDRLVIVQRAVERLAVSGPVRCSAVYESPPLGPPQPTYLNAAARLDWGGSPRALLERLLAVEQSFGRVRGERWGPRTLDLDLLWVAGRVVDEPGLVVPHPELSRRAFALLPLLDVVPHARDPRTGDHLGRWLAALGPTDLVRVAAPWRAE